MMEVGNVGGGGRAKEGAERGGEEDRGLRWGEPRERKSLVLKDKSMSPLCSHWIQTNTSRCVSWLHNSTHSEMFLLPVCQSFCHLVVYFGLIFHAAFNFLPDKVRPQMFLAPCLYICCITAQKLWQHSVYSFQVDDCSWTFLTGQILCFHSSLSPSAVTVYNVRPVVVVWDGWESCWQMERWQGLVKDERGRYSAATENFMLGYQRCFDQDIISTARWIKCTLTHTSERSWRS